MWMGWRTSHSHGSGPVPATSEGEQPSRPRTGSPRTSWSGTSGPRSPDCTGMYCALCCTGMSGLYRYAASRDSGEMEIFHAVCCLKYASKFRIYWIKSGPVMSWILKVETKIHLPFSWLLIPISMWTLVLWYFLLKKEQEIKKKNEKPGLMKTKPDADMSA